MSSFGIDDSILHEISHKLHIETIPLIPNSIPNSISNEMNSIKSNNTGITWDEEIIKLHDLERGTRQKIDEAPTPFHYLSDNEEDDHEATEVIDINQKPIEDNITYNNSNRDLVYQTSHLNARLHHLQFQNNNENYDEDEEDNSIGTGTTTSTYSNKHKIDSKDNSKSEFHKKRLNHYNEFKMIQAMRQRGNIDEEDEDDEDEGTKDEAES